MNTRSRTVPQAPWRSLVPALAPLGGLRLQLWAAVVLALTAWLALWPLPFAAASSVPADAGGALARWLAVAQGAGGPGDGAGVPWDALPARPVLGLAAAPLGLNLVLWGWVWLAGVSAAWLGGRWWGDHRAALAVGVGWQAASTVAVACAQGAFPALVALVVLPVALGLWLRALEHGTWAAAWLGGLPVGLLVLGPVEGSWWWLVAAVPPLGLALMAGRLGPVARAGGGVLLLAGLLGLVRLALDPGWPGPLPPDLPPALSGPKGLLLAGLAAVGLLHAHRVPRRWVLPACWIGLGALIAFGSWGPSAPGVLFSGLPGAGDPGGALALCELGLLLLAGGLAAWRVDGAVVVIAVLAAGGPMQALPLVDWDDTQAAALDGQGATHPSP